MVLESFPQKMKLSQGQVQLISTHVSPSQNHLWGHSFFVCMDPAGRITLPSISIFLPSYEPRQKE